MSTLNQLIRRYPRVVKTKKCNVGALCGCPQRKGVIEKVFIQKPKKPNSAKRKVAKARLKNGKVARCYIPGEGHSLGKHSVVLFRGGRAQDLIGVRYKLIRSKFDLRPVDGRISRRSKYGVKK